jgi:hypothetical protein
MKHEGQHRTSDITRHMSLLMKLKPWLVNTEKTLPILPILPMYCLLHNMLRSCHITLPYIASHCKLDINCYDDGSAVDSSSISGMANLSAVYPREIAYSQSYVDDFIHCCDDESWASVEAWEEDEPYTIPIDIVETVTGELCTFDNRRLHAARNFSPAGYQLLVRWHSFSDIVPEEKLETEAGDVVFWWMESDGLVTHLHVLEVTLIQWGLLTSCRCAFQLPTFNLSGMVKEPDVRRNQAAYVPYYKVQGAADSLIVTGQQ